MRGATPSRALGPARSPARRCLAGFRAGEGQRAGFTAGIGRGFTLLELLVALAIVAVLASAAVPAWRGLVVRAGRLDATAALMAVGAAQERHRFVHQAYAPVTHDPPPGGLGFYTSERGWYVLSIVRADATTFLAEARPAADSPQRDDPLCRVFTIDEAGRRGSAPGSVAECWP